MKMAAGFRFLSLKVPSWQETGSDLAAMVALVTGTSLQLMNMSELPLHRSCYPACGAQFLLCACEPAPHSELSRVLHIEIGPFRVLVVRAEHRA